MYQQFKQAESQVNGNNFLDLTKYPNYGLVNHKGQPVSIKPEKLGFSSRYSILILDDILPNFEEMMNYFDGLKSKGLIDNSGTFLNTLRPIHGWIDPQIAQAEQMKNEIEQFRVYINANGIIWRDFMGFFQAWMSALAIRVPCSTISAEKNWLRLARNVLQCGLTVQFTAQNNRRNKVLADKYFSLFSDVAQYHGFFVNLYAPLQLIFNLNSDALSIKLDRFFTKGYNDLNKMVIEDTVTYLITAYDIFLQENKFYTITKWNGCRTMIDLVEKTKTPSLNELNIKKIFLDYNLTIFNVRLAAEDYSRVLRIVQALSNLEAVEYVKSVILK